MIPRTRNFAAFCLLLWLVAAAPGTAYIHVKAAPSGAQVGEAATTWTNVPDLALSFFQYDPGNICITVSAECFTLGDARMFVRALVDGRTASPSDVILVNGDFRGTHAFQFAANAGGGQHTVTIQYRVDSGGTAQFGDRTLWVATAPGHIFTIAAPSGPDVSTTSTSFQDITHMAMSVDLAQAGDFFITFNAEAEITPGKRMFLRALVDGQAARPSDVVFCASPFYGTRSFTFSAPGLAAGSHTVVMQWRVDGDATGYLGDRTLTVGRMEQAAQAAGAATIVSVSAASGPSVETSSSAYSDIPGLSATVTLPDNSNLVVSVCGEAYTSSGKRMFVRASIDGQLLAPSNVVLNATGFDGVYSFHFMSSQIPGGSHQIAMQWMVDGGGTAFLGDRNMTIIAYGAPCPDLNTGITAIVPASGDRNLLVVCWDPHRPDHAAPALSSVENLIFASASSVRDYYIVNSHNRLHLNNAGVKGWYDAAKSADYYWGPEDTNDSNGDGWIHPHVEKWAEAVKKADATFNFAAYDADGDQYLDPDELVVLMIIPQNSPFGTVRSLVSQEYPVSKPFVADGITIPIITEAYIGAPLSLSTVAHELAHSLFNLPDMYFNFFMPYAAGMYSLMDASYCDSHLDPFHKIRLGWVQPAIVRKSGTIPIDAIEQSHVAYILHDPARGNQEYFIIENRQPGLAYDSDLPDAGLAIWHVMEEAHVYENLAAPAGVSAANWATIGAGDWGRRAIRMIRPVYGPPFDNRFALWDGADALTGYDLLSTDANPNHATLKWADGTPSGFSIREISASGTHMTALIEVPGSPLQVEQREAATRQHQLAQNFPNPFNSATAIRYSIARPARVEVQIFNLAGQKVRMLSDRQEQPGEKTIWWDGRNDRGDPAASGVYICRCQSEEWMQTKKMILVR